MTVHILKEHIFSSRPGSRAAVAQHMLCGVSLPEAEVTEYNLGEDLDSYIYTYNVLREMDIDLIYAVDRCDECFNHPKIQLMILANTDLGE